MDTSKILALCNDDIITEQYNLFVSQCCIKYDVFSEKDFSFCDFEAGYMLAVLAAIKAVEE
jgi:hypothetical protein